MPTRRSPAVSRSTKFRPLSKQALRHSKRDPAPTAGRNAGNDTSVPHAMRVPPRARTAPTDSAMLETPATAGPPPSTTHDGTYIALASTPVTPGACRALRPPLDTAMRGPRAVKTAPGSAALLPAPMQVPARPTTRLESASEGPPVADQFGATRTIRFFSAAAGARWLPRSILLKYRCKLVWQMWSRRGPVAEHVGA